MIGVELRRIIFGAAVFIVATVIVGVALVELAPHANRGPAKVAGGQRVHRSRSTPTSVPPATVPPNQTSLQQQDDQAFASHLSSSPSLRSAETAQVPGPGFSAAWRPLPVVNTADQWVESFVQQLLTINFATQPRTGLGPWLSAEEAPERLPGVPLSAGSKVLYLSLLDPTAVGAGTSPIPDAAAWQANAQAGVSWKVSDVGVRPDAQWSQLVASGWQPTDERFAAYQVTGRLNVSQKGSTATSLRGFSMIVYVGSARWHSGYGTVSITGWKET